jgi:hypothetical protein
LLKLATPVCLKTTCGENLKQEETLREPEHFFVIKQKNKLEPFIVIKFINGTLTAFVACLLQKYQTFSNTQRTSFAGGGGH